MLRLTACVLSLALPLTAAHAAHGTMAKIPGYDYAKERKAGYVKDYCEDSVGNHVSCAPDRDGGYKAEVTKAK